MTDDFFDNHEFSLWIFAYGISNIILLLLGGGGACLVIILSIQAFTGELSTEVFGISLTTAEVLMTLAITITNLMLIRGKPNALAVNRLITYIQITCYILFAITFKHEHKWFGMAFLLFPLLSIWIMSTSKFRAFVAYHKALHKNPTDFRKRLLQRINNS